MDLLTKNVSKSHFGHPPTRFEKGLGPPGRNLAGSWAAFGRSWVALGRSWAPLGRFLGVSWALLAASWLPNAVQEGPGLDFGGFWERPGRVSEVPRLYFSWFFRTFRYIMVLIVL